MGLLAVLNLEPKGGGAAPVRAGDGPAQSRAADLPPPPVDGTAVAAHPATAPVGTAVPPNVLPPAAAPPSLATQLADFDAALAATKTDIDAIAIAPLQALLNKALAASSASRAEIGKLAPAAAGARVAPELAKAKALRKRVAEMRAAAPDALNHQAHWAVQPAAVLTALINGKPAEVKTIMEPQLAKLRKRLADLRWQIEKGEFKAANAISEEIFYATAGATRAVNGFATDFPAYKVERDKAERAIKQLKAHGQAALIAAEIKTLEGKLETSDAVASKADLEGWKKATVAVKQLPELCKRVKTLADKLAKVAAKAPALKKKFKDAGADDARAEKMASYAQKMLVEENCSDDDAVKMAKDADGFVKAGLQETDALMSSRVKHALVAGGTREDVAQEIGKNLRSTGTSTADDAKAVAHGMRNMSKKVLEELNKAGIETECCRGPVTEALPELAGVLPRGWPAGSTWDKVPGVYSGSAKKVVVGTMEKDGKRAVPGKGEGPIPHGTPDLIGHESGHAFDAADGTLKSKDTKFLKARTDDIATGNPGGMWGPRDNYFLSTAEGGTNDAGATSETFAESFAMHFGSGTEKRWPKLDAFWSANPWGA